MSQIGLLTYHFVPNIGALMQAYALRKFIGTLGYDAEFIDYRPKHIAQGGKLALPVSSGSLKQNAKVGYLAGTHLLSRMTGEFAAAKAFQEKHLSTGGIAYYTEAELKNNPPQYKRLICGSDQVWNASNHYGIDSSYFLDFGGDDQKRIAYACSFGSSNVRALDEENIARYLKRFNAISVREKSGVDIVKRLSDHPATWVPDPTLLLDDYNEIMEPVNLNDDYCFSYVLRHVPSMQKALGAIDKMGLPIKVAGGAVQRWRCPGESVACSPGTWLGHIKYAKCVVTNSFHGTVFSIIMKRPFVTVGIGGGAAKVNERMVSLLSRLGLQDRLVDDPTPEKLKLLLDTPVDWGTVAQRIGLWRSEATDYLLNALEVQ